MGWSGACASEVTSVLWENRSTELTRDVHNYRETQSVVEQMFCPDRGLI